MTSTEYIEIDSTYRDRTAFPVAANFEIEFSRAVSNDQLRMNDAVSLQSSIVPRENEMPFMLFQQNLFNQAAPIISPAVPPAQPTPPTLTNRLSLGQGETFVDTGGPPATVEYSVIHRNFVVAVNVFNPSSDPHSFFVKQVVTAGNRGADNRANVLNENVLSSQVGAYNGCIIGEQNPFAPPPAAPAPPVDANRGAIVSYTPLGHGTALVELSGSLSFDSTTIYYIYSSAQPNVTGSNALQANPTQTGQIFVPFGTTANAGYIDKFLVNHTRNQVRRITSYDGEKALLQIDSTGLDYPGKNAGPQNWRPFDSMSIRREKPASMFRIGINGYDMPQDLIGAAENHYLDNPSRQAFNISRMYDVADPTYLENNDDCDIRPGDFIEPLFGSVYYNSQARVISNVGAWSSFAYAKTLRNPLVGQDFPDETLLSSDLRNIGFGNTSLSGVCVGMRVTGMLQPTYRNQIYPPRPLNEGTTITGVQIGTSNNAGDFGGWSTFLFISNQYQQPDDPAGIPVGTKLNEDLVVNNDGRGRLYGITIFGAGGKTFSLNIANGAAAPTGTRELTIEAGPAPSGDSGNNVLENAVIRTRPQYNDAYTGFSIQVTSAITQAQVDDPTVGIEASITGYDRQTGVLQLSDPVVLSSATDQQILVIPPREKRRVVKYARYTGLVASSVSRDSVRVEFPARSPGHPFKGEASNVDDFYKGLWMSLALSGSAAARTGPWYAPRMRMITAYDASTRTVTVDRPWGADYPGAPEGQQLQALSVGGVFRNYDATRPNLFEVTPSSMQPTQADVGRLFESIQVNTNGPNPDANGQTRYENVYISAVTEEDYYDLGQSTLNGDGSFDMFVDPVAPAGVTVTFTQDMVGATIEFFTGAGHVGTITSIAADGLSGVCVPAPAGALAQGPYLVRGGGFRITYLELREQAARNPVGLDGVHSKEQLADPTPGGARGQGVYGATWSALSAASQFRIVSGLVDTAFTAPFPITFEQPTGVAGQSLPDATALRQLFDQEMVLVSSMTNQSSPLLYSGSLVSQQQMICYEITLLNLVLPNAPVVGGMGGRIAFYPYVYVQLENVTSPSGGSTVQIYSNNPHSRRMMFRAAIDDVSNPGTTPFIKINSDGQSMTVKFKPNDNLRVSVRLPNGEVFQTILAETLPPEAPNPFAQISMMFSIQRIDS
jgi:hypothetical protein